MTKEQLISRLKMYQRRDKLMHATQLDYQMAIEDILSFMADIEIERNFNKIPKPFHYDN